MFVEAGYPYLKIMAKPSPVNTEDEAFIEKLGAIGGENLIPQYKVYQYIVSAGKGNTEQ